MTTALIALGLLVVTVAVAVRLLPGTVRYLVLNGRAHGSKQAAVPASERYELLSLRTEDGRRIAGLFGKALTDEGEVLADFGKRPTPTGRR